MSLAPFLHFTPVPLKPRHDGWSPELQFRFILLLARCGSVAEAAGRVGKSRATAYDLRGRPGAESFAVVWDAALAHARHARIAAAAAWAPPPSPVRRPPGTRGLLPGSPERQAFDRLLDALYPPGTGKTDRADEADRR
ncbi:hypothetical protein [Sphingosinicella sp. YJ22]|uniref:hypothetical protein n=1 Tax=Sphingosinicella sp. YJ22 TaxID=1104780 RepID=UPI00140B9A03|nr:hypothetical protein [Sphingosinicella sp. YJ22]